MKRFQSTLTRFICMAGMLLLISGLAFGMGSAPPVPEPNFEHEPPANPFLADSMWPMTHRNPYCQASSPYPGPEEGGLSGDSDFNLGAPGLITLAESALYPDGKRVLWGSSSTMVFKADPDLNYLAVMLKEDLTLTSMFSTDEMLSGAYTLVDRDNVFYMPRFTTLYAFGDAVAGDRDSAIKVKRVFQLPAEKLSDPAEKIVGLTLTYDGMLAFATSHGLVGVVSRSFDRAYYYQLAPEEEISNSIACDEDGGIYVAASEKMYRVQWTGRELTTDPARGGWSAGYETGQGAGVRLGAGSGSTPTLMGTGNEDKFVVITDGQPLMHLVLLWRDQIPENWQQIPGTKSRRVAAQVPVTFGDEDATDTLSEQSVCVRGYGALVVNNQLKMPLSNQVISILVSGFTPAAPYGAERFEWNPASRTLESAWVNKYVSYPNGIPCMSAATNLIYDVSQGPLGGWSFKAIDWDTGESVFSYRYGTSPIFNSAYAGTEILAGRCLGSGTMLGMIRMKP